MNIFKQFATDPELEKKGVWVEYGDGSDESKKKDPRFLLARAGGANTQYQKQLEARIKPMRRQLANDLVDTDVLVKITREVFCRTVLLGWENVTEENSDTLIPFSYENALALMTRLSDLFEDLMAQATKSAMYRRAVQELDAGN